MTFQRDYLQSVLNLIYDVRIIHGKRNLLPDSAAGKNKMLLSDSGVPLPRPATALAWASLCSLNPINGLTNYKTGEHRVFDSREGTFLLPFLPKIFAGEEQDQSLARSSRNHKFDAHGNIVWGRIYIGDASTGELIQQANHGQLSALQFAQFPPYHRRLTNEELFLLPPIYQGFGSGWQFGVLQTSNQPPVQLREPMIELARNGIILGDAFVEYTNIRVRRLLLRFTKQEAAQQWASSYTQAQKDYYVPNRLDEDTAALAAEVEEVKAKSNQKKRKIEVDEKAFSEIEAALG